MGKLLNESKENIVQTKIVFDGVDEFKNTEIASVVEITKDAMKSKLVGKVEKAQTVFDLLTAVTDADKFAEIIYDLLQECESPEEIKLFLKQRRDNLDEAIDYLKSHGFPIEHKTC